MGLDVTATYGRASELCLTKRLTAAGDIKSTAGKLYWLIHENPDNTDRYIILYDDNSSGTSDEIATFITPSTTTKVYTFDPPIPCGTGICIGTFEDSDTVVTGGYV